MRECRPDPNVVDPPSNNADHNNGDSPTSTATRYVDDDLLSAMRDCETRSRQAVAEQLELIVEAERRGLAERSGARSAHAWLRELLNLAEDEAKSRVVVARSTTGRTEPSDSNSGPELPATAEILRSGQATVDHGRVIAEAMNKLPSAVGHAQRAQADALLADYARTTSPRRLRALADSLRYHWDQDGALDDEQYQLEHRELHVTTGRNGTTILKGRIDRETGAKLRAALEPLAAPHPANDGTPDPRNAARRNADAFETILTTSLAGGTIPDTAGAPPRITVTIDYHDLKRQLPGGSTPAGGILEPGGEPITAANARRIACGSDVLPILLGGDSQTLDLGRSRRTAPADLRAALLARDGRCAFPGCDHPPGTPEAHHIRHWADGGSTSLDNMVMMCGHHHRTVHAWKWGIDLVNGSPVFTPPSTVDTYQRPRPGERNVHRLIHRDLVDAQRTEHNEQEATFRETG